MASTATPAYTGVWINWNYGAIKGATLTVPTQNAFYLVAFLAVFTGITSSHLWSILCYILFQFRSTVTPQDGQHHQHQVIFRNHHTPDSALWQFLNSALFWRGKKRLPVLAALPWALLALLHLLAFTIAGIMSARVSLVTDNGSDVLVAGSSCGSWKRVSSDDTESWRPLSTAFLSSLAHDLDTASTMTTLCGNKSFSTGDCTSYAPQEIRWSMISNIYCPFAPKMCIDNKAVRFNSGSISSHGHFGINAPAADRFSLRIVMECAPITRDGFMQDWHNKTDTLPNMQPYEGEKFLEFFYGPHY